jgi:hypothetical protein
MSLWSLFWAIVGAGAAGGLINALISDNGFLLPKKAEGIVRPGFISNVIIGAAASFVTWGLYGPYAQEVLVGTESITDEQSVFLTLSAVTGAFVVGLGGSRFLTNEVDKKLLTLSASMAANSSSDSGAAASIATASPAEAVKIAEEMSD